MRTAAKYIFLTAAGIVLFKIGSAYAYAERGYSAVGGEYFLLMLPLFYAMIANTAKSIWHEVKDIFSDGAKHAERRKEAARQDD